ncbi:MAG: hypothetical protein AAFY73_07635 [Pseudomonadota bacterium]
MENEKDDMKASDTDLQETEQQPEASSGSDKKLSRIDRIRRKIKSVQGKNPDIYPMW